MDADHFDQETPSGADADAEPLKEARRRLAVKQAELEAVLSGEIRRNLEERLRVVSVPLAAETARRLEANSQFAASLDALTIEHPLRRALLDDPETVEFIRQDVEWLRVILLVYGGFSERQLASYVVQYMEISAVLQLDESIRAQHIDELRLRPYWRREWDGGDVVYNLAVYRDTECGRGSRAARHAEATFDPQFICLDSVLTPFFLKRLRDRIAGTMLMSELLRMARQLGDPIGSATALLAALAVEPATVIGELLNISRAAERREQLSVLRNLLQQRLHLLRDGVVLFSAKPNVTTEVLTVAEEHSVSEQEDIVSVCQRSFCYVLPGPLAVGNFVSRTDLPYVNAEVWGTWMCGFAEDARYNFAVVLDTIGKKLHSATAAVNLHRAHSAHNQRYTVWALDPIPPVWDDLADVYGDALTIAASSSSIVLRELLHVGMVGYAGVDFAQAPELKTDALAATLLLPEASYATVLETIAPDLHSWPTEAVEAHVVGHALALENPTIKTRALWRLSRRIRFWQDLSLLEMALASAATIPGALQRARAYERFAADVPLAMRSRLLKPLAEAVRAIADPTNRTRALGRLALLSPKDQGASWLREASQQLRSIENDDQRAETLTLMRRVFAECGMPAAVLDDMAAAERRAWIRHKSLGMVGAELAGLHGSFEHPVEAAPLVLHAVVLDIVGFLDRSEESNTPWRELGNPERRHAAFETLLRQIAKNPNGTIPFDEAAYSSLNSLGDGEGMSLALELLPHVAARRGAMHPQLLEWRSLSDRHPFRRYASLMSAESQRMTADVVPDILELVASGKDIARYRAAVALHSDTVFIGKEDPQHRASTLGLDAILQISDFSIRMADRGRLGPSDTAKWTWMNVVFDDAPILRELVRCVEDDPQWRRAAAAVLQRLNHLTPATTETFVDLLLTHRSGFTAQTLLEGFCTLSNSKLRFTVPASHAEAVGEYWQSLPAAMTAAIRGLPDRLINVPAVIVTAIEKTGTVPAAEALDAMLFERSITAPAQPPKTLEACCIYDLKYDPGKASDAAKTISASAAGLRCLFEWLRAALADSIHDPTRFFKKRDTLLEIAGRCGQYSPATVINLIEELELQELLIDAALLQPWFNGRAGAITLLGYTRTQSRRFVGALESALTDTAEVQSAAFAMVQRLRLVDAGILSQILELVDSEDTALAYAASRLLSLVARHDRTTVDDRRKIQRALSAALQRPGAKRTVCAFEHFQGNVWIRQIGTLAQRHYQSLLDLTGII